MDIQVRPAYSNSEEHRGQPGGPEAAEGTGASAGRCRGGVRDHRGDGRGRSVFRHVWGISCTMRHDGDAVCRSHG